MKATDDMVVGDPLDERVDVGPMIDSKEVDRIENWVNEAQGAGTKVLTGGKRNGTVYYPTVLTGVNENMKVVNESSSTSMLTDAVLSSAQCIKMPMDN